VTVVGGVARLAPPGEPGPIAPPGEPGPIAGGTSRLVDVVRTAVASGVPLARAVRAASWVPAGVLGLRDVGGLVAGRRADVVVTDAGLRPQRVLRAGIDVG
jgi:N-acetylglucosamine-6-phosphate deacetylase